MSYYVYAYLDPRKKSNYDYDIVCFSHEPFYIGRGTRERYKAHLQSAIKKENIPVRNAKLNKIKKLIRLHKEPIIQIVKDHLSFEDANKLEISLIKKIGRINGRRKQGPLTNLTDGGEGLLSIDRRGVKNPFYGKKLTNEHKQKIIESNKTRIVSEETKEKIRSSLQDFKHSVKTRIKMSQRRKGKNNSFYGKKHSLKTRTQISNSLKERARKGLKRQFIRFKTITRRIIKVKDARKRMKDLK